MSKWTDVRDSIVAELHVNEVTEEVKQRVAATVVREVIPPIEQAVDAFVGKIKEQAREEKGWLYWRGCHRAACAHAGRGVDRAHGARQDPAAGGYSAGMRQTRKMPVCRCF